MTSLSPGSYVVVFDAVRVDGRRLVADATIIAPVVAPGLRHQRLVILLAVLLGARP